jgi:hypothetical protein
MHMDIWLLRAFEKEACRVSRDRRPDARISRHAGQHLRQYRQHRRTLPTVLTVFTVVARIRMTLFPPRLSRREHSLGAQAPQERLCATQTARERAAVFGPAGTVPRGAVTPAGLRKVGGATCPGVRSATISRTQAATGMRRLCKVSIVAAGLRSRVAELPLARKVLVSYQVKLFIRAAASGRGRAR